jgi:hypothetical protein
MGSIKSAGPAGGPRCAVVLLVISCIRAHRILTNSRVPDGRLCTEATSELTANCIAICKPEGFVVVLLAWHSDS